MWLWKVHADSQFPQKCIRYLNIDCTLITLCYKWENKQDFKTNVQLFCSKLFCSFFSFQKFFLQLPLALCYMLKMIEALISFLPKQKEQRIETYSQENLLRTMTAAFVPCDRLRQSLSRFPLHLSVVTINVNSLYNHQALLKNLSLIIWISLGKRDRKLWTPKYSDIPGAFAPSTVFSAHIQRPQMPKSTQRQAGEAEGALTKRFPWIGTDSCLVNVIEPAH